MDDCQAIKPMVDSELFAVLRVDLAGSGSSTVEDPGSPWRYIALYLELDWFRLLVGGIELYRQYWYT